MVAVAAATEVAAATAVAAEAAVATTAAAAAAMAAVAAMAAAAEAVVVSSTNLGNSLQQGPPCRVPEEAPLGNPAYCRPKHRFNCLIVCPFCCLLVE